MTMPVTVRRDDIAVVGYACRFPQAPDAEAFWALLREGRDAVTEVPRHRWDWRACYDPDPASGRKTNSRWGGFLDGIEDFDAWFFNIAPREARLIDPQQRLFLEVAWEALEHAGRASGDLCDAHAGVFVGCSNNGYYDRIAPALLPTDYSAGIANQNAVIANRVSFFLNLRGPSMVVDTMCSSSLVALHLACQSLRAGECAMALAGAVNVLLSPEYYVAMSRMKAHAPDGRCKTFDHRANGIVLGEGAGVVVLKSLAAALEERDTIHAVIRGSAVNHGGQAHGLSAPNPHAQAELIRRAMQAADVAPQTVSYVEAHGTGTSLGDPVEVEGLIKAFGSANGQQPWCALGSVKTNIGHLECAAGMSAFLKVLLALRHRELPALLHFEKPNPLLRLANTPFRLLTAREPWSAERPLRAGISSFGIAGTNAHVIVEEPPVAVAAGVVADCGPCLIPLSAKTASALATLRLRHAEFIERTPQASLADIAYTLQNGRGHFSHRWAIVCDSRNELVSALRRAAGEADARPPEPPRIAFAFPDDDRGAASLTRRLSDVEPLFLDSIGRLTTLLPEPAPPLFLLQVALAELWRSWGIVPEFVVGQGVGSHAAACVSGELDLLDAADRARRRVPATGPRQAPDGDLVISLPCSDDTGNPWRGVLGQLATLYCAGVPIRWDGVQRSGRRVPLPGYPFERRRHWIDLPPVLPGSLPHAAPSDSASDSDRGTHPLLGVPIETVGATTVFERRLAVDDPPFLAEHRVGGAILFPATGFLELALAAGVRTLAQPHVSVDDCALHEALRLDAPRRLHTVVVRTGDRATFQCLSAAESVDQRATSWTLHASGCLRLLADLPLPLEASAATIGDADLAGVDVEAHYADLQRRGFAFGSRFRGLRALRRSSSMVEADIEWPGDPADLAGYVAHPALLDACLHAMAATFSEHDRGAARDARFVPVGCARLALRRRLPLRLRVRANRRGEQPADGFIGDLQLFDEAGSPVGSLTGLRFQRAATDPLDATGDESVFHQVHWVPAPALVPQRAAGGRIVILGDSTGVADELETKLEAHGFSCVRVRRGAQYAVADDGSVIVDPTQAEDLRRLFDNPAWANGEPLHRVVHLWALDAPCAGDEVSDQDIDAAQKLGCGTVLNVAQAMIASASASPHPPRLCIVTRLAQPTGVESGPVDFFQSLPWGLVRTLALEHPELRPIGVDIESLGSVEALVAEVLSEDRDNQVALRHSGRRVAQLAQSRLDLPAVRGEAPLRLTLPSHGVLDDLVWRSTSRRSPGAGEVAIETEAIGLNFRDVMVALGVYPGTADAFGGECAGRITAVGAGVEGFAPGDLVIAAAPGSLATHVVAPSHLVAHRPAALTPEEAATIPVAFLTAAHALRTLGAITSTDRVLIHAAAGGVGLAAVQIAQQAGAEIFATAGSRAKREFLSSVGVAHVMDSRSTGFTAEVLRLTGGRGVDVVLNSLTGEFIPCSIEALATNGRFLEIGKVNIWSPARVAALRPDVRYEIVAIDVLAQEQPSQLQSLFGTLLPAFAEGALRPLPYRAFSLERTEEAFRHMTYARHIGKVVLSLREHKAEVRADAEYLITGGAGALGLHVARSLVERGARHLTLGTLAGRGALSDAARAGVESLEAGGVSVRVVKADVSRREEAHQLLESVRAGGRPLAGVVHAAGILDDGVFQQLTYERIERVLAPKVAGAIHLHALTAGDPLDFLVFFSSMIGVLGSPGQANYAAANAFLDGLAHYRHALARPALSINWGPWREGGMADQSQGGRRWIAQGITPIDPPRGVAALWRAIASAQPQVGVLPVDWAAFAAAGGDGLPLLASLCAVSVGETGGKQHEVLEALKAALPSERRRVLLDHLRVEVAATLGLSPGQALDPRHGFLDLGMDSLTAVEFRNRLFLSLRQRFAPTLIFDYPTLDALADHLAHEIFAWDGSAGSEDAAVPSSPAAPARASAPDDVDALLAELELLSDDAARALSSTDLRP